MYNSPLISAPTLATWLAHPNSPVVLDCSFDLQDPDLGERRYRQAHVPGAQYVHLERDLSGPKINAQGQFVGRHPLRERSAYAQLMGFWGIGPDTRVVVLDNQGGMFAARLWWTLRWMGHSHVLVLNGGQAAWHAAGFALDKSDQISKLDPFCVYPTLAPAMATVLAEKLREKLPNCTLIDARSPERFRGDVEPLDKLAGHILGARNRCFKDNLQPNGVFKARHILHDEFKTFLGDVPPEEVVHYCGSGVTSCHNLLAMHIAGFELGALYPGSWSEWSALDDSFVKRLGRFRHDQQPHRPE
jgi:thiosulfate/3-mercaptopyruvate sulfurtransferase